MTSLERYFPVFFSRNFHENSNKTSNWCRKCRCWYPTVFFSYLENPGDGQISPPPRSGVRVKAVSVLFRRFIGLGPSRARPPATDGRLTVGFRANQQTALVGPSHCVHRGLLTPKSWHILGLEYWKCIVRDQWWITWNCDDTISWMTRYLD